MSNEEKPQPGGENTSKQEVTEEDIGSLSEEELRRKIEEHVRQQKVSDVLVQFMASLSNLAYMKMGITEDTRDIKDTEQARLAIDSFKALLDAAGPRLEDQDRNALAGALASMQMTFVKAAAGEEAGKESGAGEPDPGREGA